MGASASDVRKERFVAPPGFVNGVTRDTDAIRPINPGLAGRFDAQFAALDAGTSPHPVLLRLAVQSPP